MMREGKLTGVDSSLPLVLEPISPMVEARSLPVLKSWALKNKALLEDKLPVHGGILFRGFAINQAKDFEDLVGALEPQLLNYVGGDSPRTKVGKKVYTSTSHPAEEVITLHNELSYVKEVPKKIFFFCLTPAHEGGETPIVDGRKVYEQLDAALRDKFESKKVMYVQNMHGGRGLGKSWQETFETESRGDVEAYLKRNGIEWQWTAHGLRTTSICEAVITHPKTGQKAWFNQADAWHLGPKTREMLLQMVKEDELPHNVFFGDGSPISGEDLAKVTEVLWKNAVVYPWQKGDVLMLDNLLVLHGRKPFKGPRQILVAMS